jgi:hypothetical protein
LLAITKKSHPKLCNESGLLQIPDAPLVGRLAVVSEFQDMLRKKLSLQKFYFRKEDKDTNSQIKGVRRVAAKVMFLETKIFCTENSVWVDPLL